MEGPSGSIIAYSTAPGSVANDGRGRNGLYTKHLMAHMLEPGLSLEALFRKVRVSVKKESVLLGQEQVPLDPQPKVVPSFLRVLARVSSTTNTFVYAHKPEMDDTTTVANLDRFFLVSEPVRAGAVPEG